MSAAITLQSRVRVLQCKKELMKMKTRASKRELASTKLQSCWRSWACRRELLVASNSAACIQRCYNRFKINKGMLSGERMKVSYAQDLQEAYMAATTIQCAYRVQLCQRELLRRKEDAHLSAVVEEAMAATKIQSVTRMWICQRMLSRLLQKRRTKMKNNDAVVVIQSFARSLICQRELASLKDAAIQADYTKCEGAAIVLQSYFRSVVCQRQLAELKEKNEELLTGRMSAAITIQSRVRVLQCKKELMK